jgi:hypothetical protein
MPGMNPEPQQPESPRIERVHEPHATYEPARRAVFATPPDTYWEDEWIRHWDAAPSLDKSLDLMSDSGRPMALSEF